MNILLIAQSMVYGTIMEQALKKEKSFNVALSFNKDHALLNQLSVNNKFDALIFIASREVKDFADRLHFLHQLFGCPIFLIDALNTNMPLYPWLIHFPHFPLNPTDEMFPAKTRELIHSLKHFKPQGKSLNSTKAFETKPGKPDKPEALNKRKFELIAIGASTGGPQILNFLFKNFPEDLPVPILVVQHMPANFIPLFIDWLNAESALHIQIASDNEQPKPGHVYFAPGHQHMILSKDRKIKYLDGPPLHNVTPSVSHLFKSVAEVLGPKAIGILLTGMGKDGAQELALIKERGGLTIVQDKESCVVFGMPGVAIKLGAAQWILSPGQIVEHIKTIFKS